MGMAQTVPIPQDWSDKKAVEAWLRTQAREMSVALAARAALRVLPLLDPQRVDHLGGLRSKIVLPMFRSTAAPWIVAVGPRHGDEEPVRVAAAAAAGAAMAAFASAVVGTAAQPAFGLKAANVIGAASQAADAAASIADDHPAARAASGIASFARGAFVASDGPLATDAVRSDDPQGLSRKPLWPGTLPETMNGAWSALRDHLLATDEGWEVWTTWYGARLRGDPVDVALETRRVIEPVRWNEGPAAVNAEIAEIIADHTARHQRVGGMPDVPPELPEPRLAPVTFGYRDGQVHREPAPSPDPPPEQAAALRSAWTALRESLSDVIDDDPGREVQLGRTLQRCLAALGSDADSVDIVLLGEHARTLSAIAQRADDILLPEIAAQVVSLDARLAIYLAWFPSWGAYAEAMAKPFAEPAAEQAAVDAAKATVAAINNAAPDLIAPDAREPLDALAEAATPVPSPDDPEPVAPAQARRGLLRSTRDLLMTLSDAVMADVGTGMRKGVQKVAEKHTVAALGAATVYLTTLAAAIPGEFQFLLPVIAYLKLLTNRS